MLGAALAGPVAAVVDLRPAIGITILLFVMAATAGAMVDFMDRGRYDPVATRQRRPARRRRAALADARRECPDRVKQPGRELSMIEA